VLSGMVHPELFWGIEPPEPFWPERIYPVLAPGQKGQI
jgi:hypothetical protein